jgi:hypothetical protein
MALYHIRTLNSAGRTSLVSNADLPDDLAAVSEAKHLLRQGESVEIWRGEKLVYRMGPAFLAKPGATRRPGRLLAFPSPLMRSLDAFFGPR